MANKKIRLRIVTPAKMVYDNDVEMIIVRGVEGDLGIMPGHEALTTILSYGVLRIFNDDEEKEAFALLGGFMEVNPEGITLMSDAAERPHEIDKQRALAAKERAEARLANAASSTDIARAELALRRSLVRLDVTNYNTSNDYTHS